MDDGVASLIGAIVGGGLATATSFGLDARRAKQSALADEAVRRLQARQAARMILDELSEIHLILDEALHTGHWSRNAGASLPTRNWRQYSSALAASGISDDRWTWISMAFQAAREGNGRKQRADAQGGILDGDDRDYLVTAVQAVTDGIEALRNSAFA